MVTVLFWLILAVMTGGVIAALIVPILRDRPAGWKRGDFSRQVYRDQLRELDVDVERGVITGDEAEAARIEIQRRLITTDNKNADDANDGPAGRGIARRAAAASIAILVPVVGLSLYVWLGNPGAPNAPQGKPHPPLTANAGRAAAPVRPPAQSSSEIVSGEMAPHELDENIAKLKARLEENPADLQGWLLLGRSLTVTDRHSESVAAFQKAIELDPTNVDHKTMAAESMVLATGGRVTDAAEAMFGQVLAARPSDPASRYYIALSRAQADKFREAFDMWRSLLLDAPVEAPWRAAVAQRVRDMAERLGIDVATAAPQALPTRPVQPQQPAAEADNAPRRGPSQEDMAAAAKMSPEERQQMIRGMVEGLADRLEDDPSDAQGWQRLVRVYGVLGEKKKAYAAMERAAANVPDDVGALLKFAGALMGARGPGDPAPKAAIDAFERVLKINPQNPGALYYVGQVQAESGQIDQARATWQRLLERLDPANPSYATVKRALEKLNSAN